MTTITCDTTPGGDGNIHAVVFHPLDLPARADDVWDGVDVGTVLDLVDQTTGATSSGTLAAYETSVDVDGGTMRAVRIDLTITPG